MIAESLRFGYVWVAAIHKSNYHVRSRAITTANLELDSPVVDEPASNHSHSQHKGSLLAGPGRSFCQQDNNSKSLIQKSKIIFVCLLFVIYFCLFTSWSIFCYHCIRPWTSSLCFLGFAISSCLGRGWRQRRWSLAARPHDKAGYCLDDNLLIRWVDGYNNDQEFYQLKSIYTWNCCLVLQGFSRASLSD